MLSLNLQPLFLARGIDRPYTFLVKAGFPPYTAHNLLSGKTASFRLRNIEKLCILLNCTPDEILVWKPEKNRNIPDDHQMKKLLPQQHDYNWQDTFKNMPLGQLRDLVIAIKNHNKPPASDL